MTINVKELAELRQWLTTAAFPLWSTLGCDTVNGGFFERLTPSGDILHDPRRARLVGRQIFAFAVAERLGWNGPAREMLRHGLDFLLKHIVQGDVVRTVVTPAGEPAGSDFDLYDQAFVLFGLAAAAGVGERPEALKAIADGIRLRMGGGWKHPVAGFEESRPRSLPLKANPHMHILEASMAWEDVDQDPAWRMLSDEITELCLSHFLDRETGALREFFDGDWRPIAEAPADVVEPGHQSEWAWLLTRWGLSRNRDDALTAARRLVSIAENRGVSDQNLSVNELNADLSVRDARHRLWPQTERIKSFVAMSWIAPDEQSRTEAAAKIGEAAAGLLRFLDHPVRGSWWEHLGPDGLPADEPARASSLYHITCAVQEMAGAPTR